MGGKWIVDYTTSPPPSNGKLGPFTGFARQIINLEKGTYLNYLSVPGDIEQEWLSAELEATFTEWDGNYLEDDRDVNNEKNADIDEALVEGGYNDDKDYNFFSSLQSIIQGNNFIKTEKANKPDYGASNWKVDFKTLTVKVFGFPLITKEFENTSRIWKMSYLDDDTRVVRAGRTGKDKDNMLFYMSRE